MNVRIRKAFTSFPIVALQVLTGCSHVYQLTKSTDIPVLPVGPFNPVNREKILAKALENYNIDLYHLNLPAEIRICADKQLSSSALARLAPQFRPLENRIKPRYQCEKVSDDDKAPQVPPAVAAVLDAAVRECSYETYQQDTANVSPKAALSVAGAAVLGAGIGLAVGRVPSSISGTLAAGGAGVAIPTTLQNAVPSPAQASTPDKLISAGLSYYPLMRVWADVTPVYGTDFTNFAGQSFEKVKEAKNAYFEDMISELSGLWDEVGSACPTGVLKGQGWNHVVPDYPLVPDYPQHVWSQTAH